MLEGEDMTFDVGLVGTLGFRPPPAHIWDFQWLGGSYTAGRPLADAIAGNSWHRMTSGTYGAVYPRTALVMHDLEKQLGGDVVARGMKLYYARWHHRHPSAADLREALAEAAGEQADIVRSWFDQQVYASDVVDDEIDAVDSEEIRPEPGRVQKDGKMVERTKADVEKEIDDKRSAYKGDDDKGPFPFRSVVRAQRHAAQVPQTVIVEFADGSQERIAWPVGERWHRWVFERPAKVVQARLDPTGSVLTDVDKLDDGRTREAHRLPAARWSLEGTTWVETLLSLVSSL
jgi:hypothetical protein